MKNQFYEKDSPWAASYKVDIWTGNWGIETKLSSGIRKVWKVVKYKVKIIEKRNKVCTKFKIAFSLELFVNKMNLTPVNNTIPRSTNNSQTKKH